MSGAAPPFDPADRYSLVVEGGVATIVSAGGSRLRAVGMAALSYHSMCPAILVFCAIGVFSLANTQFDVYLMALFGVLGYLFRKLDCEPAPMMLGFILGPMMEEYLRRALLMSKVSPLVLVTRPISATLLVVSAVALVVVMLPTLRRKREEAFRE